MADGTSTSALQKTPLFDLHEELGGKMVPFAGYAMPVQYPLGIMKEHIHCREAAGLFDVSHMGQAYVHGLDGTDPAAALEEIMPGLLTTLEPGKMKYTLMLNDEGGIMDDLMVTRTHDAEGTIYIVVNASVKEQGFDRIEQALGDKVRLEPLDDNALIALQGPAAEAVLADLAPEVADLYFMEATSVTLEGVVCWVSRSGYTGEDGYEISIPSGFVEAFVRRLLRDERVQPIGLGARDSLRLEAGLCLSGSDFDQSRDPIEAALNFTVSKKRVEDGTFVGAARIQKALSDGTKDVRVALQPAGRAPIRGGAPILSADGTHVGVVTSGGFGPTVGAPVAMGYVQSEFSEIGTELVAEVRGKHLPMTVAKAPFIKQTYKRRPKA